MLALALLLAYGGFRIRQGALTLGVLVAFFQYGLRFFRPIQDLSEKYNILQGAMAASERDFQAAGYAAAIVAIPQTVAQFRKDRSRLNSIRCGLPTTTRIGCLRDVSFRVARGRDIGGCGPHRRGENHHHESAAALLRRAARRDPHRRDRYPRVPVSRTAAAFWRGAARSLSIHRHSGDKYPARDREDHRHAQVRAAAEQVNLLDFIDELPDGFGTAVRERGSGFSTGQKQLISFARALAHDPRILILDEATSSVDTETELRVREALSD